MTLSLDLPVPRRALAIGAHPDDIEFGAGATLAKWAAGGCRIANLVCTDGSKGSWDPDEDIQRLIAIRQDEQRAASRALGGDGEVVFLGWTDGELESGLRQRWEVCFWIRKLRPNVVLGHDPWRRYRLHPDHRHAGFLATDGIVAARDPHFFPEQSEPAHRPDALLLWEADDADHVESATEPFIAAKLDALLSHRSQFRSTMKIDDPTASDEIERFRTRIVDRLTEQGQRAGVAAGEAFKILREL
jgi:LmbE family N-acetylglucosaminyl deacetylase